jgi:hypothetical protein
LWADPLSSPNVGLEAAAQVAAAASSARPFSWETAAQVATVVSTVAANVAAYVAVRSARSARAAVALQAQQLGLQRQQFHAAQEAARPRLAFTLTVPAKTETRGRLAHVGGEEAALNIRLWVRSRDPDCIRLCERHILAAGGQVDVVAEDVPERAKSQIPPRLLEGAPDQLDHWVVLEWEDAQGRVLSMRQVQQRRFGAPPRPL